ncbi:MAG: glutaredoxin domain-containing protein [candidate division WOR-3 bacterium]
MEFQVFARENCHYCTKAQKILRLLNAPMRVRYIDGPNATPENMADLAWLNWVDEPPLVVVVEGKRVLQRWDGQDVASRERAWYPVVREWLRTHTARA